MLVAQNTIYEARTTTSLHRTTLDDDDDDDSDSGSSFLNSPLSVTWNILCILKAFVLRDILVRVDSAQLVS